MVNTLPAEPNGKLVLNTIMNTMVLRVNSYNSNWRLEWELQDSAVTMTSTLGIKLHDRVKGCGVTAQIETQILMEALRDGPGAAELFLRGVVDQAAKELDEFIGKAEEDKGDKTVKALQELGKKRGAMMDNFQKMQGFFAEASREYRHQHPLEKLEIGYDIDTDMVVFHLTGGAPVAAQVHARVSFDKLKQFIDAYGRVSGKGLEAYIQIQLKRLRAVLMDKIEKQNAPQLASTNISEDGDDATMTQVMQPLGGNRKRTIRRPPVKPLKQKKIMCPTHDVPLVYNEDRGLWKCTQSGCRIIHRPKVDTDVDGGAGHLGQGALDIRIAVTEDRPGNYTPKVFLVAENNVSIDITDYVDLSNISHGVHGAIAAARVPGQPAYVDHNGAVFPIRVPRVVVVSLDK